MLPGEDVRRASSTQLDHAISAEVLGYLGQEGKSCERPHYSRRPKLAQRTFERLKRRWPGIENEMSNIFAGEYLGRYARELCCRMIEAVRARRAAGMKPGQRPDHTLRAGL